MNKKEPELYIKKELPRGLVVSSTIAIFFVLALIPFITWLLEYKDTVSAPLTMTTRTTPVDVHAKISGELVLLVKNEEKVQAGQVLAYIHNAANFQDIGLLKKVLHQPNKNRLSIAKSLGTMVNLRLGIVADDFAKVSKAIEDYQAFQDADQHQQLIQSNEAQIQLYQTRKSLLEKRGSVIAASQDYDKINIERQASLLKEGVIAAVDFEEVDKQKFSHVLADLDNQTSINDLGILSEQLRKKNIEIKKQFKETKLQHQNTIRTTLQLLEQALAEWELNYAITAPIDGICLYKSYWNDHRFVQAEEKIFSLLPQDHKDYFALLQLSMQGAGKIQKEQQVYVKLNNYPFMEYGVLKGEVSDIAPLPFENRYKVQVEFPNGFTSSYDSTFNIAARMQGIGEIIIHRKSLWNRIGEQIKSLQHNQ